MGEPKQRCKEIPEFASEEEELAFWDQADIAEYFEYNLPPDMLCVHLDKQLQEDIRGLVEEYDEPYHPFICEILRCGVRSFREHESKSQT